MQCTSCKKEIPADASFCVYCGVSTSEASVAHANTTPAPTSKRFWNEIFDGFVILIISSVLGASIFGNNSLLLNWLLIPFVYYFISEVLWAKSPAKFLTKTKVVTEAGGKPTASQVATRSVVRLIPFYPLIFLFTTKAGHRIGWHDRFAHTLVVEDK